MNKKKLTAIAISVVLVFVAIGGVVFIKSPKTETTNATTTGNTKNTTVATTGKDITENLTTTEKGSTAVVTGTASQVQENAAPTTKTSIVTQPEPVPTTRPPVVAQPTPVPTTIVPVVTQPIPVPTTIAPVVTQPPTVPPTTLPPTTLPPTTAPSVDSKQAVLDLVNAERTKAGLQPLQYYYAGQSAADVRASEIGTSFSHTRPNGTSCFTALEECGINYYSAGENIASGYPTPESVMNGWMNSSGHKANILDPDFTHIIVGRVGNQWVQLFLGI